MAFLFLPLGECLDSLWIIVGYLFAEQEDFAQR